MERQLFYYVIFKGLMGLVGLFSGIHTEYTFVIIRISLSDFFYKCSKVMLIPFRIKLFYRITYSKGKVIRITALFFCNIRCFAVFGIVPEEYHLFNGSFHGSLRLE